MKFIRPLFFLLLLPPSFLHADPTLPGFTIHFNDIDNPQEGRNLVKAAKSAGASIVNIIPPAQIWQRPDVLAALDETIDEVANRRMQFMITRLDATCTPDRTGRRADLFVEKILPGTAADYESWLENETRFYAKRYGGSPQMFGFSVGVFSDPFAAPRPAALGALTGAWLTAQYEKCAHVWQQESERKDILYIIGFRPSDNSAFTADWAFRAEAMGLILTPGEPADAFAKKVASEWNFGKPKMVISGGTDYADFRTLKPAVFIFDGRLNDDEGNVQRETVGRFKKLTAAVREGR